MLWGKRLLIAAAAMSVATAAFVAPAPETEAGSTDCFQTDMRNAAKLDVTTDPATIVAGENLNGTVNFLHLVGLSSEANYTLEGPDGTTVGPKESEDGEVVFADVPLCNTGKWEIVNEAGTVVNAFESYKTEPTISEIASLMIDETVDAHSDIDYKAGWAEVHNSADCGYTGDLEPSIGTGEKRVRVAMDWTAKDLEDREHEQAMFAIQSDGEYGNRYTMVQVKDDGSQTLSTLAVWKAGGIYTVDIYSFYEPYGVLEQSCNADAEVTPLL